MFLKMQVFFRNLLEFGLFSNNAEDFMVKTYELLRYLCENTQTKMVLELRRNIFTLKFKELIYLPQYFKT